MFSIESIEFLDSVGEMFFLEQLGADGEIFIDMLVVRSNMDSRRMQAPGIGVYNVFKGDSVDLSGFDLGVNNISPDEKILVCFLAFDNDEIALFFFLTVFKSKNFLRNLLFNRLK